MLFVYIYTDAPTPLLCHFHSATIETHAFTELLYVGQVLIHQKSLVIFGVNEYQEQVTLKVNRYLISYVAVKTEPAMLI